MHTITYLYLVYAFLCIVYVIFLLYLKTEERGEREIKKRKVKVLADKGQSEAIYHPLRDSSSIQDEYSGSNNTEDKRPVNFLDLRESNIEVDRKNGKSIQGKKREAKQKHELPPSFLRYFILVLSFLQFIISTVMLSLYILGYCDIKNDNSSLSTLEHFFHLSFSNFLELDANERKNIYIIQSCKEIISVVIIIGVYNLYSNLKHDRGDILFPFFLLLVLLCTTTLCLDSVNNFSSSDCSSSCLPSQCAFDYVMNTILSFTFLLISINIIWVSLKFSQRGKKDFNGDEANKLSISKTGGTFETVSPVDNASFFNYFTFSFMNPLLNSGYKRQLNVQDIYLLPKQDNVDKWYKLFKEHLEKERDRLCRENNKKKKPSLLAVFHSMFGYRYYFLGLLQFLNSMLSFAGPILLEKIVTLLEQSNDTEEKKDIIKKGSLYVVILALCYITSAFLSTQFNFQMGRVQLHIRSALLSNVYEKALDHDCLKHDRFSHEDKINSLTGNNNYQTSTGEIMDLITTDCQRLMDAASSFHTFWSLPLQVAITLYLLHEKVQFAFIAGIVVIVIMIPVNTYITKRIQAVTKKQMKFKDSRVEATTEMIYNIKGIKYHAWEDMFLTNINKDRSKEVKYLSKRKYLDAWCVYLWATTPLLTALATFFTVVWIGGSSSLTPATIFYTVSLLNMLIFPMNAFPWVLNGLMEAHVSYVRLKRFLFSNEQKLGYILHFSGNSPTIYTGNHQRNEAKSIHSDKTDQNNDVKEKVIPLLIHLKGDFGWEHKLGPQINDIDMRNPLNQDINSNSDMQFSDVFHLKNIDFRVYKNEMVGIYGVVGSGKTSLLYALLGELCPFTEDTFLKICDEQMQHLVNYSDHSNSDCVSNLNGLSFAFCSQDPWIPQGTIQDAILFGTPFDERWYNQCIINSGLKSDLESFKHGDQTEIGSRGSTLSGGQKARIAFARALYENSDIILLDDIFSGLDVATSKHIVSECLIKNLKGRKTIVIVTDNHDVLQLCDRVIEMEDGRIKSNKVEENALFPFPNSQTNISFSHTSVIDECMNTETSKDIADAAKSSQILNNKLKGTLTLTSPILDDVYDDKDNEDDSGGSSVSDSSFDLWDGANTKRSSFGGQEDVIDNNSAVSFSKGITPGGRYFDEEEFQGEHKESIENMGKACEKTFSSQETAFLEENFIQDECRKEGTVSNSVYNHYFKSIGKLSCIGIFLSLVGMQLSNNGFSYWLSYWSANMDVLGTGTFLKVSATLALINSFLTLTRSFIFAFGGLQAAVSTHDKLLQSITSTYINFFESQPTGRIINRVTCDIDTIDDSLPFILNILLAQLFNLLGSLLIFAFSNSLTIYLLLCLGFIYYYLQQFYRASSREIRRLDSVTRSPVFNHLTETIEGRACIRAFRNKKEYFLAKALNFIDNNQRLTLISTGASCWLSIRLQGIGVLIMIFISISGILQFANEDVDDADGDLSSNEKASLLGLSLSYAVPIVNNLSGLLNSFAETEKEMISVERVMDYLDLANENDTTTIVSGDQKPPADLYQDNEPLLKEHREGANINTIFSGEEGYSVCMTNLCLRYRPNAPLALNNVNITIGKNSHVAIVGRTGSGKSSLISCLFRMTDYESGSIRINGVDIKNVFVRTLRSNIAIIPQDPTLFKGTLRYNLDPLRRFSDHELVEALQICGLNQSYIEKESFSSSENLKDANTSREIIMKEGIPETVVKDSDTSFPNNLRLTLDTDVGDRGKYLSAGTKQLICLCRTLLRKDQIHLLCIDEATAHIDKKTDDIILSVLSSHFQGITMLMIAHRLEHVKLCSRVLVMDQGKVIEDGNPDTLLETPSSCFFKLSSMSSFN